MSERTDQAKKAPLKFLHPKLEYFLLPAAKRIRETALLRSRAALLGKAIALALVFVAIGLLAPAYATLAYYLVATFIVGALVYGLLTIRKGPLDYRAAAARIETENPELNQILLTAVSEVSAGSTSFFAQRITDQALKHPSRASWDRAAAKLAQVARIRFLGTMLATILVLYVSFWSASRESAIAARDDSNASEIVEAPLVEPGDIEVQRGSPLVVTARYAGALPAEARLVTLTDTGEEIVRPMAQSLSDPVFARSLPQITESIRYRVDYEGTSSATFRVKVFDLPELTKADAILDYPDYTGWQDRTIEDTRKLSAIEGSKLEYRFSINKPLRQAYLAGEDGERIELSPTNSERTQFALNLNLEESLRLRLYLEDEEGRRNDGPNDLRIDVLPNSRPVLRVTQPSGDQRLSPIQEVSLQASASDDFGLLDFGIAYSFGGAEPTSVSLKTEAPLGDLLETEFATLLALEQYGVEPKDTLSWYAWAEDFDSRGTVRRSTSDLYFGDIRPLDEIFREQDGGGMPGQAGQGNEGADLIGKQRRISISLFRIKNEATDPDAAIENLNTIQSAQVEVQEQLRQLLPRLQEPAARDAATDALRYMEGVYVSLTTAVDTPTLEPLDPAWADSQGAYGELVKLTDSEFSVSRSQSAGGGGGGPSRNQAQLDELEFNQAENRYETATQAKALSSPEERQNLELMNKLEDLSRRQDDMNQRLQEMQSAMANARSEEERERIRRELKRLEEEQRKLLADADEAIQQAGSRQSARSSREQLEQARENMQRAGEQLEQGEVSQALASGSRARETIERTREELRENSSAQFSDALREARNQARELAENQQALDDEIDQLANGKSRRLDDSEERDALAQKLDTQSEALNEFLEELQSVVESAEAGEPGLYRSLYKTLRENSGQQFEERYDLGSQLLRQGFTEDAQETQQGLNQQLQTMSEQISEAAQRILGNEENELQFARSELDKLTQELDQERQPQSSSPSNSSSSSSSSSHPSPSVDASDSEQASAQGEGRPSGEANGQAGNPPSPQRSSERSGQAGGQGSGQGGLSIEEMIRNALSGIEESSTSPLTGGGFSEWIDRLQTVEAVVSEPEVRSRLSEAREIAEGVRREFKRHGELPQWEVVEAGIVAPLDDARLWIQRELRKIENPDELQPIDRDPVPEEFADAVKRYYESLGAE